MGRAGTGSLGDLPLGDLSCWKRGDAMLLAERGVWGLLSPEKASSSLLKPPQSSVPACIKTRLIKGDKHVNYECNIHTLM